MTWSRVNRVFRYHQFISKNDPAASRAITVRCASAAGVRNEVMTSRCQLSDEMMTFRSRSRLMPTFRRVVDMFKRRVDKMISIFSSSPHTSCGSFWPYHPPFLRRRVPPGIVRTRRRMRVAARWVGRTRQLYYVRRYFVDVMYIVLGETEALLRSWRQRQRWQSVPQNNATATKLHSTF